MTMRLQGPVRLSGVTLLKKNLLDPVIYIATSLTYLFCLAIGRHLSTVSFFVLFMGITWLIQRHIEAYRSFRITRKWTRTLEGDENFVHAFLLANFSNDYKSHRLPDHQTDTYLWINKIVNYFWPYLAHVVHHELNEFLAHPSLLMPGNVGLKRFIYAFIRQIDANIFAIEHCELGARAPFIKSLIVFDEGAKDKTLIYDLDLAYEGNMNMSFVCRYCCCCSSRMGFKDVFVHLRSRLMIGPIEEDKALIDAVSFSLLELPAFGYKGIALVELAELRMARRSINRLIKDHLLHPKQVRLTMAELERKLFGADERVVAESGPSCEDDLLTLRRPPLTSRILARLTCLTCMCSNSCLRFCQRERVRLAERAND